MFLLYKRIGQQKSSLMRVSFDDLLHADYYSNGVGGSTEVGNQLPNINVIRYFRHNWKPRLHYT